MCRLTEDLRVCTRMIPNIEAAHLNHLRCGGRRARVSRGRGFGNGYTYDNAGRMASFSLNGILRANGPPGAVEEFSEP